MSDEVKVTAEDWEKAAEQRAQFCYEQAKGALSDADVDHWQVQHMAVCQVIQAARRIATARRIAGEREKRQCQ